MAKRIQPKLSHQRHHLIDSALWRAATDEAKSLLRNLYMADRARTSSVLTGTREEYIAEAREAASTLVDYLVLHGTLSSDNVMRHIDYALMAMRDEDWCASYRDAAMAMAVDLLASRRAA